MTQETERARCQQTIDSIGGTQHRTKGKVNGRRPWWRRQCKRYARAGSDYCWQHQPTGYV